MTLTCRTCGGAPGHHRPSMLDPSGASDPGHRMTGSKPCETCGGDGYFSISSTEPYCPNCNGTGVQPESGILKLAPDELAGLAGEAADKSAETMNAMLDQPTPPSTENELRLKVTFEVDGGPATLQEFMAATVLAETLRNLSLGTVTVEDAYKTIRREQHRHTAEVLKGLRDKRTTVDNLDVIFWYEVVQLIAAEEQAMKGEKA